MIVVRIKEWLTEDCYSHFAGENTPTIPCRSSKVEDLDA